jgi:hypothetical protein
MQRDLTKNARYDIFLYQDGHHWLIFYLSPVNMPPESYLTTPWIQAGSDREQG